ncbi:MAG: radical SAM family heme chaperone HemW [bacterium]
MTAGLYIHIPFCEKRCGYCDFYTVTRREAQIPAYLNALKKEINLYSNGQTVKDLVFETLFFGGGTPSLLEPEQIASLSDCIFSKFNFVPEPEITLETNPGTVNLKKLKAFRSTGINRLSLGIQSFQPNELKILERIHSVAEAVACFKDARKAGFANISMDLIFALPNQKLETWKKNLELAVTLAPNHISAYNLTIANGTPFKAKVRNGTFEEVSEEVQRAMYLTTIEYLQKAGFYQYEISNFAQPNYPSRHNQMYWDGSSYLGLGTSAHSFINNRRFWNLSNLWKYNALLAKDELPIAGEECLELETQSLEKIFLGLRQLRGINLKLFEEELGFSLFDKYLKPLSRFFSCNLRDKSFIRELTSGSRQIKAELLKIEDGFLRLTKQGLLLCDAICAEFV